VEAIKREGVSTRGDDIEERKRALIRARGHSLGVERVAIVAAGRRVDKAFEVRSLSLSSSQPQEEIDAL
jgi:hypothetical protein